MSDDLVTDPSATVRQRFVWIGTWLGTSAIAVLVALALPGWLEIAPWSATATGAATTKNFQVVSTYQPQRTVVTIIALIVGLIVAALVTAGARALVKGRSRRDVPPTEMALAHARRGVMLLALANAALVVAGIGAAAYLDASGHPLGWRSVTAFNFANYVPQSAADIQHALAPSVWVEPQISSSAATLIAGGVILVALITVVGWSRLRLRRAKSSKYVPFAGAAAVMALIVSWLEKSQLRTIPQYYIARYPTVGPGSLNGHTTPLDFFTPANTLFTHAGYGVALVGLGLFVIVELVILAVLLLDAGWLAVRHRVSPRNTLPVVVVRDLALAVALSVLVLTVASLIAV